MTDLLAPVVLISYRVVFLISYRLKLVEVAIEDFGANGLLWAVV